MTHELSGRILAIDLGEKRIGIALSDPLRLIARPYEVLARRSRRHDFDHINAIVVREGVALVVMGLPVPLSGEEGQRAAWVRDYSEELAEHLPVPLTFMDESFSTQRAAAALRARGKDARQGRAEIDAVAAAFILQDYLDGAA